MVDTGKAFKYDVDKDEFVVAGTSHDYVFTRRYRADGTKTQFFTRYFAHVAIVASNL